MKKIIYVSLLLLNMQLCAMETQNIKTKSNEQIERLYNAMYKYKYYNPEIVEDTDEDSNEYEYNNQVNILFTDIIRAKL